MSMYTVDDALAQILPHFAALPAKRTSIRRVMGRVLAEDVIAELDLPPFPNSSMDGYAVRAADIVGTANTELSVIGDIPAGTFPTLSIAAGQAMRIMTGAPMPDGADTVIPVENTSDESDPLNASAGKERMSAELPARIRVIAVPQPGEYVRPVGEDIQHGQTVLRAGRVLRAADIGVLAGLGISRVAVIRRPKVAILSTGDELLGVDKPLTPGKIRDMNTYTIGALVQALGARVIWLGIARDNEEDVRQHLERAVEHGVQLILSSAGVSVGAFDVVKSVVELMGALDFWKVNMRPGKPLAFGQVRGIPYLGLPGNPVSAMVTFDVFARPAIRRLTGRSAEADLAEAVIDQPIQSDGRRTYMRVTVERRNGILYARSTGSQSSGVLTSLVNADGLLIIPEGMTDVPAGTRLPIRLFDES